MFARSLPLLGVLLGLLLSACGPTNPTAPPSETQTLPAMASSGLPTPAPSGSTPVSGQVILSSGSQTLPTTAAPSSPTPAPTGYTPVSGQGYDGVIVREADAPGFGERAEGYWTPAAADIIGMEAGLADYLRTAAASRSPDLWQKQASYKRQYAGLVRDGQRLVYASFFCDTVDERWREQIVMVLDGGDCYFQLTYTIDQGTYQDLMINGEA